MRKHIFILLAVFFLSSCGFSPDESEVQNLISESLAIDCPSEFTILKSYNARVIDDYLEAVIIEFTADGYKALIKQIDLKQWLKNEKKYSFKKQLDERYNATLVLDTENRRLRYERLHH